MNGWKLEMLENNYAMKYIWGKDNVADALFQLVFSVRSTRSIASLK